MIKYSEKTYSKIAKAVSEFVILSILEKHPHMHTYEIQQKLLGKFTKEENKIIQFFKNFNTIFGMVEPEVNDAGILINKEVTNKIHELFEPEISSVFLQMFETIKSDKKAVKQVLLLKEQISIVNEFLFGFERIWDTSTGIYQVMKELEGYGLIEVSKEETVNGRNRKLYQITMNGKAEAIRTIFSFISITKVISEQFKNFTEIMNEFYKNHVLSLELLLTNLNINVERFIEFIHDKNDKNVDPFTESKIQFLMQILIAETGKEMDENWVRDLITVSNVNDRETMVAIFKAYRKKMDRLIEIVETLDT